ncbi:hypothetical protein CIPAW_01G109600 [Carya illinoinensis]|uniref:Uncharacterized protein n=1 Tax=Carya illinoinensis TaxID=32201 RepID=A0A8T1RL28_CARIL|nr:hypothetical protein CIPAW_01G109600 [Carya illinoinensis]
MKIINEHKLKICLKSGTEDIRIREYDVLHQQPENSQPNATSRINIVHLILTKDRRIRSTNGLVYSCALHILPFTQTFEIVGQDSRHHWLMTGTTDRLWSIFFLYKYSVGTIYIK